MAKTPEVKYRVGNIIFGIMIAIAAIGDALQLIFTITGFLMLFADLVAFVLEPFFAIWFFLIDPHIFGGSKGGSKFLTILAMGGIELIPVVDGVAPTFTWGVIRFVRMTRAEDREKAAAAAAAAAKAEEKRAFQYRQREIQKMKQAAAIPSSRSEELIEDEEEAVY